MGVAQFILHLCGYALILLLDLEAFSEEYWYLSLTVEACKRINYLLYRSRNGITIPFSTPADVEFQQVEASCIQELNIGIGSQ